MLNVISTSHSIFLSTLTFITPVRPSLGTHWVLKDRPSAQRRGVEICLTFLADKVVHRRTFYTFDNLDLGRVARICAAVELLFDSLHVIRGEVDWDLSESPSGFLQLTTESAFCLHCHQVTHCVCVCVCVCFMVLSLLSGFSIQGLWLSLSFKQTEYTLPVKPGGKEVSAECNTVQLSKIKVQSSSLLAL